MFIINLSVTTLQNRCVNIIAHLFHAPIGEDDAAVGVGTVGSSEAIMLAGLAFKRKWQAKRKSQGKSCENPNIVTGSNVQVWLRHIYTRIKARKSNVTFVYLHVIIVCGRVP